MRGVNITGCTSSMYEIIHTFSNMFSDYFLAKGSRELQEMVEGKGRRVRVPQQTLLFIRLQWEERTSELLQ